ncbi:MAG: 2-phospho-L-lactate guanylyltransferase [bacterium]|nr:2-phospho-L-lactate guanylyltransferase [bacterium]
MRLAAAVPVKDFTRAKKRLRSRFSDAEVERILRALLADVLDALKSAKHIDRVLVLTDDPAVADAAREAGARVRERKPDPGLNPVIDEAAADLEAQGYDGMLVVLGDLPLLKGADIDAMIDASGDYPVVIAPAADEGTALLLRRPPTRIPARFGPESSRAHQIAAQEAGCEALWYTAMPESTRVDLDTPDDAVRLIATAVPCRTREILRELLS